MSDDARHAIARHCALHTGARTLDIKLFALDCRLRGGLAEREQKPFLCVIPTGGAAGSSIRIAGATAARTRIWTR